MFTHLSVVAGALYDICNQDALCVSEQEIFDKLYSIMRCAWVEQRMTLRAVPNSAHLVIYLLFLILVPSVLPYNCSKRSFCQPGNIMLLANMITGFCKVPAACGAISPI